MAKKFSKLMIFAALFFLTIAQTGCKVNKTSMADVSSMITAGSTAPSSANRVLILDVRPSNAYINGHVKDAICIPLKEFSRSGDPLYTNTSDTVSTSAATGVGNSWLSHMLVNQLVNDFTSTYADSKIIFYGASIFDAILAAQAAQQAGFTNVSYMDGGYAVWNLQYSAQTAKYFEGVDSVDSASGSFVFTGFVNKTNFDEVSTSGTWHGIVYKNGGMSSFSFFQSNIAPFCFQELLTYLGASPNGNMADGINISTIAEDATANGQQVQYSVTWDGTGGYHDFSELFEEKKSLYEPADATFSLLGIEARIGGTKLSSINWNSGCIFCFYSCTVGITSNAKTSSATWNADGGIYDETMDPRNFYAGRFYPRMNILPGSGTPVKFKVSIVHAK